MHPAKEELIRYKQQLEAIATLSRERDGLREATADYAPAHKGPVSARRKKIDKEITERLKDMEQIGERIRAVENPVLQKILSLYYLDTHEYTLLQITNIINRERGYNNGMTYESVRVAHKKALDEYWRHKS